MSFHVSLQEVMVAVATYGVIGMLDRIREPKAEAAGVDFSPDAAPSRFGVDASSTKRRN